MTLHYMQKVTGGMSIANEITHISLTPLQQEIFRIGWVLMDFNNNKNATIMFLTW